MDSIVKLVEQKGLPPLQSAEIVDAAYKSALITGGMLGGSPLSARCLSSR